MKRIPLTRGLFALVDDEDYARLACWKWHANGFDGRCYARRSLYISKGVLTHFLMHRDIAAAPIGLHVDHINGDTLDNRRANLRVCTPDENARNVRRRKPRTELCPYKGVKRASPNRWEAKIRVGGRTIYLGMHLSAESAARAYDAAAIEHFGEFAALNFDAGSKAA